MTRHSHRQFVEGCYLSRDEVASAYDEGSHLYPGLCLHDGRVSGSITAGCSRLPLWAISSTAIHRSWKEVEAGWAPTITQDEFAQFVRFLLWQRGEFGRLLLVLADAERCEQSRAQWGRPWWTTKKHRKRVSDQLRRCLSALDEGMDA